MNGRKGTFLLLKKIGLHPLSAFSAICVDIMLFGPELSTPPSIIITFIFGFLICIPVFLLQKFGSNDSAKIAMAKALIIGILTAIPSPLPSVLTVLGALLGFFGTLEEKKNENKTKTEKCDIDFSDKNNYIDIKSEKLESEKK